MTQREIALTDESWYVPHQWPKYPSISPDDVAMELERHLFCGHTQVSLSLSKLDSFQLNTWSELVAYTIENFSPDSTPENRLSENSAPPSSCTRRGFSQGV